MPLFDTKCADGHESEVFLRVGAELPPCHCGAGMSKIWKGSANIKGDEIPGGMVIENIGHEPVTVYSHAERRRLARERGLQEFVRHTPVPGTDKSPYTTSWATVSKETLDGAKEMLEAHATKRRTAQEIAGVDFKWEVRDYNPDAPQRARFEGGQIIDREGELS